MLQTRASLTPHVADTVVSGVHRAHLTSNTSFVTVSQGIDRAHVAGAGASVLAGVDGARAFDGVDRSSGCRWSQQESHNNKETSRHVPLLRHLLLTRYCRVFTVPISHVTLPLTWSP